MIKHKRTGKIREIFLASKHLSPDEIPVPPPPDQSVPGLSDEGEGEGGELSYFSPEGEWEEGPYQQGGEEAGSTSLSVEGGELQEDMIPEDLPPEVREALLLEIQMTRGDRY